MKGVSENLPPIAYRKELETIHKNLIDEYFPNEKHLRAMEAMLESRPSFKDKEAFEKRQKFIEDLNQAELDLDAEELRMMEDIHKQELEDDRRITRFRKFQESFKEELDKMSGDSDVEYEVMMSRKLKGHEFNHD